MHDARTKLAAPVAATTADRDLRRVYHATRIPTASSHHHKRDTTNRRPATGKRRRRATRNLPTAP